jgi:hypothetical protein
VKIEVKSSKLFYGGTNHKVFNVKVNSSNATIDEDMDEADVVQMCLNLVDDTILDNVYSNQIVEKLVEVGLISNEMIQEYLQGLDND